MKPLRHILRSPLARRLVALALGAEAVFVTALSIVLVKISESAGNFEGDPVSPLVVAAASGIAVTGGAFFLSAAWLLWRDPRTPLSRTAQGVLYTTAGLHFVASLGSLIGLGALLLGTHESQDPGLDALWYGMALIAGLTVSTKSLSAAKAWGTAAA